MYQALGSLSGEAVERILLQSQRQSTKKCTLGRNFASASVGYQKAGSQFSRQQTQAACGSGKPVSHRKPGLHLGSDTVRGDKDSPQYSGRATSDGSMMPALSTHWLWSQRSPQTALHKSGLPSSAIFLFFFFQVNLIRSLLSCLTHFMWT